MGDMMQQDDNNTYFFLGLQIFLPRVTEKLDRIPKDPSADPEDEAKVPEVRSTTHFQGNSLRGTSSGEGVESDPTAQQCLKSLQTGEGCWGRLG